MGIYFGGTEVKNGLRVSKRSRRCIFVFLNFWKIQKYQNLSGEQCWASPTATVRPARKLAVGWKSDGSGQAATSSNRERPMDDSRTKEMTPRRQANAGVRWTMDGCDCATRSSSSSRRLSGSRNRGAVARLRELQ